MDDPIPQFIEVIKKTRQADIAYPHLVESRISGASDYNAHHRLGLRTTSGTDLSCRWLVYTTGGTKGCG